jgi:hypothetical protein
MGEYLVDRTGLLSVLAWSCTLVTLDIDSFSSFHNNAMSSNRVASKARHSSAGCFRGITPWASSPIEAYLSLPSPPLERTVEKLRFGSTVILQLGERKPVTGTKLRG